MDAKQMIDEAVGGADVSELVEAKTVNPKAKKLAGETTDLLTAYEAKAEELKKQALMLADEADSRSAKALADLISRVCSTTRDVLGSLNLLKSGDYREYY